MSSDKERYGYNRLPSKGSGRAMLGADLTKLLLRSVPLEYAAEMTRPVDTKAW